jgi:hypothetical protein
VKTTKYFAQTMKPYARDASIFIAAIAAVSYCLVVVAANFSFEGTAHGQEHGWPLVYMIRESDVPGDLTVLYGPWPFDDPPLIEFRWFALAANISLGICFAGVVAGCAVYWLRQGRRKWQISLLNLFVLLTIAALAVGLLTISTQHPLFWVFAFATSSAPWLAYAAPVSLVITTAHWLAWRGRNSPESQRRIGLHWLTWIALFVAVGPLVDYVFNQQTGITYLGIGLQSGGFPFDTFGWPLGCWSTFRGSDWQRQSFARDGAVVDYVVITHAIVDLLILLAVLASVVIVVERWIRRIELAQRAQFSGWIAAAIAIAGTIAVLWFDPSFRPEWYSYPVWLFGVASTIFALEILSIYCASCISRGAQRLARRATLGTTGNSVP